MDLCPLCEENPSSGKDNYGNSLLCEDCAEFKASLAEAPAFEGWKE